MVEPLGTSLTTGRKTARSAAKYGRDFANKKIQDSDTKSLEAIAQEEAAKKKKEKLLVAQKDAEEKEAETRALVKNVSPFDAGSANLPSDTDINDALAKQSGQLVKQDVQKENIGNAQPDRRQFTSPTSPASNQANLASGQSQQGQGSDDQTSQNQEKPVVDFPIIMFGVTILEWVIVLLAFIISVLFGFTAILIPIALILGMIIYLWKITFSSGVLVWATYYEFKHLGKLEKKQKRAKTKLSFSKKKWLLKNLGRKAAMFVMSLVPLVDFLLPWNTYTVWSSYLSVKKEIDKK